MEIQKPKTNAVQIDRAVMQVLSQRALIPLGEHTSELDAAWEHWLSLSPKEREEEIVFLRLIASIDDSGGP